MNDAETIAVYDARAQEYADRFSVAEPGTSLKSFMALLPQGGDVLDLGCGPGQSSAHMAKAGFAVVASDASFEMVQIAATQPGVTARHATFADLSDVAAFDGVWANFSLLHAPRDQMDAHLTAIARALRPGGVFHIGMKTGDGSERDGIGRKYTYYTVDDLTARLTRAGFDVIDTNTGSDVGMAGTNDPWVVLKGRLND